jgi:transcriptional regulator with XRE-family HTH domain
MAGVVAARLRLLMEAFQSRGLPSNASELARYATAHAGRLGFPGRTLTSQTINNILTGRTAAPRPQVAELIAAVYGVAPRLFAPTVEGAAAEVELRQSLVGGSGPPDSDQMPLETSGERAAFLRRYVYPASLGRPHTTAEIAELADQAGHAVSAARITAIEDGLPAAPHELETLAAVYMVDADFFSCPTHLAQRTASAIELVRLSADLGGVVAAGRHLDTRDDALVEAMLPHVRILHKRLGRLGAGAGAGANREEPLR